MITTIIFDLGDVFIRGFKGIEKLLEPVLGLEAEEIFSQLRENEILLKLFRGQITEDEYWTIIIRESNWDVESTQLKEITRRYFKEIDGTRDIIEILKEKNYKLGLLSVHAREWIEHCEKEFDYHKLFNSVLYSFEVGVCKPDKKAYEMILEKLEVEPKETIFIDDNEKFLKPAEELGIRTIQFHNAKQLKQDLKNAGIDID